MPEFSENSESKKAVSLRAPVAHNRVFTVDFNKEIYIKMEEFSSHFKVESFQKETKSHGWHVLTPIHSF